jgi:uncharacterized protein (DUF58 family)
MLPKEVLRKIRRIEITTSRLVTDVFAGQYHSIFKGRGIEFDEVREYIPGDDIRSIDWNVTARMGSPYVKKYVEERELTVMLVVDMSRSCRFGSVKQLKSQLAAELCSVLAFSAIKNSDKVGFIAFTDKVEKFIVPRKGLRHVLRVIREALYFKPAGVRTDVSAALEFLNGAMKRKAVCFIISDFYDSGFKKLLSVANRRHDVIAVTITDPRELEMPDVGIVRLEDAETGEEFFVDTASRAVREEYNKKSRAMFEERRRLMSSIGVDNIDIRTDEPYTDSLLRFFKMRERRLRRRVSAA